MINPKILIVDDRHFDRLLYKEYLDEKNYTFHELQNGEKIIETISSFNPDLILLDWQMPGMCGKECVKAVRSRSEFDQIPIVIITGFKESNELSSILQFENIDFLNKPVSQLEIKTRVNNTLKYAKHIAI